MYSLLVCRPSLTHNQATVTHHVTNRPSLSTPNSMFRWRSNSKHLSQLHRFALLALGLANLLLFNGIVAIDAIVGGKRRQRTLLATTRPLEEGANL